MTVATSRKLAFVFLAMLIALPVVAQNKTTGSVNGVVTDNTGAVLPGVTVTAVEASANGDGFVVRTDDAGREVLEARSVVVASGIMQTPKIPGFAAQIPDSVQQFHTADYRSADTLPPETNLMLGYEGPPVLL